MERTTTTDDRPTLRLCALAALMLLLCVFGSPTPSHAQGNFTVTEADIAAMRLAYYNPLPDKKLHGHDFVWTFRKGAFTIRKGKVAIPSELQQSLLPKGQTADEIKGKWALKNGNLVLSKITAGKKTGRTSVRLDIYKTAMTLVQIRNSGVQYAFGIYQ